MNTGSDGTGALGPRRLWVFDLDGTLTVPCIDFAHIRAELGVPRDRLILEHLGAQPRERARQLHVRLEALEAAYAARATPAPGCRPLLERLAAGGARCAILTRNTRGNAHRSLEAIGVADLFDAQDVLGRDEALPKPDPDGLLALQRRHGRCGRETVMVGDFRLDLEAGRNAGCLTVHVAPPGGERWPDLTDVLVDGLPALTTLIGR